MKQKFPKQFKKYILVGLNSALVMVLAGVLLFASTTGSGVAKATSISELQERSRQLQAEIAANQKIASEHHHMAETLQAKVDELNGEISLVSKQIELLSLQIRELELKIEESNEELERQRGVLGANIRVMYFEGDISTIEMLATSQDLSEFVDKEQYRTTVQDKIKTTVDRIKVLRAELKAKQEEVQKLLDQQQAQRELLNSKRQEQQRLLDATRGQEAAYRNIIDNLRRQQARAEAEIARAIGGGGYVSFPVGPVAPGDPIGGVGMTGFSTGYHLHFEVRNANGAVINPGPYIQVAPVAGASVSQDYGVPNGWYASGYHSGIDYSAPKGTQIHAAKAGYLYRGCSKDVLGTSTNAYGYVAIVKHSDGSIAIYAHMTGGPAACDYTISPY